MSSSSVATASSGSDSDGEQPIKLGIKIHINIYEVPDKITGKPKAGHFHAGVEVLGEEYSYGDEVGMFTNRPRKFNHFIYKEQMFMGKYYGGLEGFKAVLEKLRAGRFYKGGYNSITNNCNEFADALCLELVGKSIPEHLTRRSRFAQKLSNGNDQMAVMLKSFDEKMHRMTNGNEGCVIC